jgi:rRNA maturation RNase YbeY
VAVTTVRVRTPVATARLAEVARLVLRSENVADAMLSITLVSERHIAALNARHLRHRGPTDVISFVFHREPGDPLIGDIYISPGVARENAKAARVGVREELIRLVVHGVLHVLGHDHPEHGAREQSPMWRRQEALVARALRRRRA